ncbi:MAG: hypothetical protein AB4062_22080 [Crocosphaera sp.]
MYCFGIAKNIIPVIHSVWLKLVWVGIMLGAGLGPLAILGAIFAAWGGDELKQENFSPVHQFLILSGVSLGGLVFGFLIGWLVSVFSGS